MRLTIAGRSSAVGWSSSSIVRKTVSVRAVSDPAADHTLSNAQFSAFFGVSRQPSAGMTL
jgi:hypothetical protein